MQINNLIGQKFGKLTVIERADDYISKQGQHHTRWRCLCDCGNVVIKNTSFFKNGKVFNCGCEKRPSRFFDIAGWNMWEHDFRQN